MSALAERIDTIERGYEYLLAYAAQGRRDDAGSEVRATLSAMRAALDGLANEASDAIRKALTAAPSEAAGSDTADSAAVPSDACPSKAHLSEAAPGASEATTQDAAAFVTAVTEDARKARSAIALVLTRPAIGSLLVDNLNASIHLRALLTDLFLIEQALKS